MSKAFILTSGQIWFKTRTSFSDVIVMRKPVFLFLISTLVCMTSGAQLDPLLVAPSTGTPANPEEVDSRYTIRNRPPPAATATPAAAPTPVSKTSSQSAPPPIVVSPRPVAPKIFKAQEEVLEVTPAQDAYDDIPYDISKNFLEVTTDTFLVYNDSRSNYKYRNYNTFSQGLGIGVDVWIERDIGIETVYKTTVNGHTGGMDRSTQMNSTERWFDFSLQIRNEFESSRSPYFVSKIGFSSYQKKLPVDNLDRSTLETSGPKLEFELYFPTSNTQMWNLGLELKPFQTHKEKAVGANLGSGDNPKTWAWGLGLGHRTIFNRKYQFFWKVNYHFEKTLFTGDTKQNDPWAGAILSDVPVNNSFLFLNLGFIWGG